MESEEEKVWFISKGLNTLKFHDNLKWYVVPVFELLWYGPLAKTFNISLLRYSKPKNIYGKFTKSLVNNPVLTFNLEITGQIDPSLPDYNFPPAEYIDLYYLIVFSHCLYFFLLFYFPTGIIYDQRYWTFMILYILSS